jgi:Family of unknown function (DUF5719)
VVSVLVVVIGIGIISAAIHTPAAAPAPGILDGVRVPPADASTSSAFCAAGTGQDAISTIYLTNSTTRSVTGVMTTVGPSDKGGSVHAVRRAVMVPPLGISAVNPAQGRGPGSYASSFTFAGGGVVASQVVSGPLGWSTAPCATQTSSQWAFAGGSTTAGNSLVLSLFDPAAPETVVDVTFVTNTGLVTPQAYQGLVVGPGKLVTLDVGQYVQKATTVATFVATQSGAVVSSEFQAYSRGSVGGLSVRLGSPELSNVWRFPQITAGRGSTVSVDVANPGRSTVGATVSLGLSSGSVVPRRLSIPPLSVANFVVSGTAGLPQGVPYSMTINSSGPVVAGRSVLAAAGSPAPMWGSSSGTTTSTTEWLIPAPGVVPAPGTPHASIKNLAVADPGVNPARVGVYTLAGRAVAVFTVDPRRLVVLSSKVIKGLSTFVVRSSQPVAVEEDSHPSGASGVVSSTGFPLVGT